MIIILVIVAGIIVAVFVGLPLAWLLRLRGEGGRHRKSSRTRSKT